MTRLLAVSALLLSGCSVNRTVAAGENGANREPVPPSREALPTAQGAAATAPENTDEVIDILEKHIAAIGGRDAHKAIKTVETEREAEIFKGIRKTHEFRDKTKQRFYSKTDDPNGTIEMGFDGKQVWQKSPFFRGYLAESDPSAKALRRKRPELYEYKETGQKFTWLPNETIDGKQLIVLQTRSSDFDPLGREIPVKYFFDANTFLLRQIVMGADVSQKMTLDDYREVNGTRLPFLSIVKNPNVTVTSKIKRIQYNVPIDPALFEYHSGDSAGPDSGPAAATPHPAAPRDAVESQHGTGDQVLSESVRMDTFELVWSTVNDTYWDPKFGGVDWKAVHDKYLPLAKTTSRSDEFHELLNQMLAELDRSHFRVRAPDETVGLHSKGSELRNGAVGLDLRWIDGQLVVFNIKKDYPADRAGIRRGFQIVRINGKDSDQLFAQFKSKRKSFQLRDEIERVRAAIDELSGLPDTEVTLEVASKPGTSREVKLIRKARLPDQTVEFESRMLENNIGYIRFSPFFGDAVNQVVDALQQMHAASGLVIDLRGNPGGVGDMTEAIASRLCAEPGSLGLSPSRYGSREHTYSGSGKDAYPGRVVLLVDEMTGSAAEVFSAGLQENKRVTVIGATTAGSALPSVLKVLPTGGAFQHVIAGFTTPKGIVLEGRGVTPDVKVQTHREALLKGRDPALDRAVEFLKSRRAKTG